MGVLRSVEGGEIALGEKPSMLDKILMLIYHQKRLGLLVCLDRHFLSLYLLFDGFSKLIFPFMSLIIHHVFEIKVFVVILYI